MSYSQHVRRPCVYRILGQPRPITPRYDRDRFNELDLIADARRPAIDEALTALVQTGHAIERGDASWLGRGLVHRDECRLGGAGRVLGPVLARRFADGAGLGGLSHVLAKPEDFRQRFQSGTGFSSRVATVAAACAVVLPGPTQTLQAGEAWGAF